MIEIPSRLILALPTPNKTQSVIVEAFETLGFLIFRGGSTVSPYCGKDKFAPSQIISVESDQDVAFRGKTWQSSVHCMIGKGILTNTFQQHLTNVKIDCHTALGIIDSHISSFKSRLEYFREIIATVDWISHIHEAIHQNNTMKMRNGLTPIEMHDKLINPIIARLYFSRVSGLILRFLIICLFLTMKTLP